MIFAKATKQIPVLMTWGMFWLAFLCIATLFLFDDALVELFEAWQLPEYAHGPLIPLISAFLFLKQLKSVPVQPGPLPDRWPGFVMLIIAILIGLAGKLIQIGDIVAYALILWVGAVLLISFGWQRGKHFWPPVLHLIYMLPLPGALYYGVSTYLQTISSELGVALLRMMQVSVYLDGNIIDLGVMKLHVAEACSGLRYLFPILSFSYIFAVLYRGPTWHKAVLLVSAVPITIVMNSVRIAVAGVIVNNYGAAHLEGFSHFFEGWVIFILCIAILFGLAWAMLWLHPDRPRLRDALDLDSDGLGAQAMRLQHTEPSRALVTSAVLVTALALAWQFIPTRETLTVSREPFALFPQQLGDWDTGPQRTLTPDVAHILAADDYYSAAIARPGLAAPVDLFIAWYATQNDGGVHSPEVCLPGGGWEIAELAQRVAPVTNVPAFTLNRAIIQKGTSRMLVYYWFEQQGQRTASGFDAKLQLMLGKMRNGRDDSALVRLITPIEDDIASADARLAEAAQNVLAELPRFVPDV